MRSSVQARGSRSRRPRGESDDAGGQRWMTTYADAVTLLLAFFILLYAMSEIDVMKFTAFLQGLRVPFGNVAGDGLLPESDGLQPEFDPVPPGDPIELPERPDRRLDQPDRLGPDVFGQVEPEVVEAAFDLAEAQEQLDAVEEALEHALEEAGFELLVERRREERGLVVSVSADDVLFALGSTEISEVGREIIAVVAEALGQFPNPIQVEGHTDNIPLTRPGYTNWNLSTDRAVAVLSRMIEEHGLPPTKVGAVGYGEYRPLESNDTPEGRARNRRVDIVVLLEQTRIGP